MSALKPPSAGPKMEKRYAVLSPPEKKLFIFETDVGSIPCSSISVGEGCIITIEKDTTFKLTSDSPKAALALSVANLQEMGAWVLELKQLGGWLILICTVVHSALCLKVPLCLSQRGRRVRECQGHRHAAPTRRHRHSRGRERPEVRMWANIRSGSMWLALPTTG